MEVKERGKRGCMSVGLGIQLMQVGRNAFLFIYRGWMCEMFETSSSQPCQHSSGVGAELALPRTKGPLWWRWLIFLAVHFHTCSIRVVACIYSNKWRDQKRRECSE